MSGDIAWGVSLASRGSGNLSRELERVVARPELRVLRFHLRELALELRDAGAERRDLGLAVGVALGVFGLLASAVLDEVELSLAAAAEAVVLEDHGSESGPRGRRPAWMISRDDAIFKD